MQRGRVRLLVAAALVGQGLLVLSGVLDHETPAPLALALVLAGAALLAWRGAGAPTRRPRLRAALVAALGGAILLLVVAYNLAAASSYAAPEVALVAYAVALLAAAPRLTPRVERAVAWSFPLVLAPLALWALNALLVARADWPVLVAYVEHGLAAPMTAALGLLGVHAQLAGTTVAVATPRGTLFLTVGVVCAGLYATVLFLGLFALFAWESGVSAARATVLLAIGLVGLHLVNVARLVLLALVGERFGADALMSAHRHAGWALFLAFSVAFWWAAMRKTGAPA